MEYAVPTKGSSHSERRVEEKERGKRQLSRRIEAVMLILIGLSLYGTNNAFELLQLLLPYAVALVVALRGLDAHYNPKRLTTTSISYREDRDYGNEYRGPRVSSPSEHDEQRGTWT